MGIVRGEGSIDIGKVTLDVLDNPGLGVLVDLSGERGSVRRILVGTSSVRPGVRTWVYCFQSQRANDRNGSCIDMGNSRGQRGKLDVSRDRGDEAADARRNCRGGCSHPGDSDNL